MPELQLEHWPIERLIEYARNPRRNDAAVDQMCGAIREFGFRIPIVARSDGTVVDGHLRLKAARRLGLATVPVVLADELTEAQIKAFRLLANQSANWAEWDEELLRLELEELQSLDFDLDLTGFNTGEIDRLLAGAEGDENTGLTDEDAVPDVEEKAVTRPGELWVMGNHRLFCGDATKLADVERALGGALADLCVTDFPYNVAYEGKGSTRENRTAIRNDKMSEGAFAIFLHEACAPILSVTKGAIYIAMSSAQLHTLRAAFEAAGGHWSTFIIWAKDHFTLGRSDYQRMYEPLLYGWRQGNDRFWCGARDQGDVWFAKKPRSNDLHPTMKPVELFERAIRNSSKSRDIVLDPFAGSGTTAIAAEKLGRQARLIEINPVFCDVIVKRWQEFTGEKALLDGEGLSFVEAATKKR
ncbi:MAG: DNA modification methylase [Pseudorhodoplanes sp.]|nr:DNA modification methylase [Pseudorhodoplanes sp.]